MIEIGRLCVKTAGRDAGRKCVIIDILDKNRVLIDGQTRRRPCNIFHLEPLKELLKIKKGASHEEVADAFKELNLEVRATKPKKAAARPKKVRKTKSPEEKEAQKKAKEEKRKKKAKKIEEKIAKEERSKEEAAKEEKPKKKAIETK